LASKAVTLNSPSGSLKTTDSPTSMPTNNEPSSYEYTLKKNQNQNQKLKIGPKNSNG